MPVKSVITLATGTVFTNLLTLKLLKCNILDGCLIDKEKSTFYTYLVRFRRPSLKNVPKIIVRSYVNASSAVFNIFEGKMLKRRHSTFSITTPSIATLRIMTLSITTLSIKTFTLTILSITTLSIITLSILYDA
jgi:hypothetical protein